MIFCFDIDETICTKTNNGYHEAQPFREIIQSINGLYNNGHEIIVMTARGSVSKVDYTELTKQQLSDWGLKYHKLLMNIKPNADIFVDDKGLNIKDYIKKYVNNKKGIIAGSFDIIHPGYVHMFKEAKKYCSHLTIALHNDPSVERKNKLQPILSYEDRENILSSIKYVDEIIKYDTENNLLDILKNNNFDVRILGDDYKYKNITGKELCKETIFVDRQHGWSTTDFKKKIFNNYKEFINK
jgi:glycerol-3-phosphate cytidylyltransferase